jgi:hypothetical protein
VIDKRSGVLVPDDFATLVPTDRLIPCDWNPNRQSDRVFRSLIDNIRDSGFDQAIEVVPIDEAHEDLRAYLSEAQLSSGELFYLIVGGHHRWEAAKVLDMGVVPVVRKDAYDHDMVKFQNARKNLITGRIDPEKFQRLYMELAEKGYEEEFLRTQMGLVEDKAFKSLVRDIQRDLPSELREQVDRAIEDGEVDDMDSLSRLLNELLTTKGDTLHYNYLMFEYGGKSVVWVKMTKETFRNVQALTTFCYEAGIDVNLAFGALLENAEERLADRLGELVEQEGIFE